MLGVGEVLDVVDNLLDYDCCGDVDGLLGVGCGVGCFEGLLSPECLAADGLASDIHGEHLEEGVGFVVSPAQGEEEGLEDTEG